MNGVCYNDFEITNKDYNGLVDGFITCYEALPNKFYYIPVDKASKGCMTMYYGNNPKYNQNWCKDYDFDNLLS